ncbi:MAG: DNA polymerase III subunit gamma/tau [Anaerolineaceae bacterium]
MSQALYRTWRPTSWEEVVGQEHIVQTLKNAVATNRVGQAYLFAGPRGTGKTTSARLLAKAVNCLAEDLTKRPCNACENCLAINQGRFLDLIEIDAASNTSVDDIRELRDKINFSPSQGRYKVYIIDEVHMLSTSAFNALLKTLEEPPSHVIFILATTEIHKIPATVLSRCQRHEFRRIPVQTIVGKLKEMCKQENIAIEDDALSLIARQATGSMRDAISLVDQLSSLERNITLSTAQDILGTATSQSVIDLVQAILDQASGEGLEIIHKALDAGADPRQYARQVVEYLRTLLVIKLNGSKDLEILPEVRSLMNKHAKKFETVQLIDGINTFSDAATDLKANWHPGLGLELAFASAISREEDHAIPSTVQTAPVDAQTAKVKAHVASAEPKQGRTEALEPVPQVGAEAAINKAKAAAKPAANAEKPANQAVKETAPAASGSPFTLENVRSSWDQIKRAVRSEDPVTGALLNSSRLIHAENNTITINFSSDLLRDKMMEEKSLRLVRKVLVKFYAREILIACTVGSQATDESGEVGFTPDGLVDMTVRQLGGKVRKVELRKNEKE